MRERYLPKEIPPIFNEMPTRWQSYKRDAVIFLRGEQLRTENPALFLVQSGLVGLSTMGENKMAINFIAREGDIFGFEDFGLRSRTTTARALTDAKLKRFSFDEIDNENPKNIAREVIAKRMAERVRYLTDTKMISKRGLAPERIADALMVLAVDRFVNFTHENIAEVVGMSRQNTSKELGNFAKENLIAQRIGAIEIVDFEGLSSKVNHVI